MTFLDLGKCLLGSTRCVAKHSEITFGNNIRKMRHLGFEAKTKLITLASHKGYRQTNEPTKTLVNTRSRREARENVCDQVVIGFVITCD